MLPALRPADIDRPNAFLHPRRTHARWHDQGFYRRRKYDPARTSQKALLPFRFSEPARAFPSHADELIAKFHVKTPSRDTLAKNLSGGNIQKMVLAREISRNPRVIIAAQPTRGLDIGATEYVREQLLEQRNKGAAIMLISEDLDEILALSDRIAVIYEGQIMDIVPRENATPEKLGF